MSSMPPTIDSIGPIKTCFQGDRGGTEIERTAWHVSLLRLLPLRQENLFVDLHALEGETSSELRRRRDELKATIRHVPHKLCFLHISHSVSTITRRVNPKFLEELSWPEKDKRAKLTSPKKSAS